MAVGSPVAAPGARGGVLEGRGGVVSALSTGAFFLVLALLLAMAPGVDEVVSSFFAIDGFRDSFAPVASGFWLNVQLMLVAEAIVLVLGLAVAVVRSLRGPVFTPLRIVAVA